MIRRVFLPIAILAAAAPASGAAGPVGLVNQTGAAFTGLLVRPAGGGRWIEAAGGLSAGARTQVVPAGDGCAFDLRASLAGGGEAVWSSVNLCETRSVTLNRRPDGTTWVDYD